MKKRIWILGTFVVLASLALFVTGSGAQPGTVKQIVPGVWFREGDLENLGHCNNIIEMKDYLIVVDANFPSGARLATAAAKQVSSKPVKYVFDTHHHGDHAYGNPIWTRAGATTLAYKGVAEEMSATNRRAGRPLPSAARMWATCISMSLSRPSRRLTRARSSSKTIR